MSDVFQVECEIRFEPTFDEAGHLDYCICRIVYDRENYPRKKGQPAREQVELYLEGFPVPDDVRFLLEDAHAEQMREQTGPGMRNQDA